MSYDLPTVERKRPRSAGVVIAAVLFALFGAGRASPQADVAQKLDQTRSALEKWVETRQVISKEKRDWSLAKEVLAERIAVVKAQIESVKKSIAESETASAEAAKKKAELTAESDRLKSTVQSLNGTVGTLESRVKVLLPQLPEPIRMQVKVLSQRIPETPEAVDPKTTIGTRFESVVGILNEVNKFNREISLKTELRSLPDGTAAEVTTMYVGIGQAYFVGGNGIIGGTGASTPGGFVWTAANEAAAAIARAVAILKNAQPAAYVPLPIRIQ
jgi:hypothetical protein